MEILIPILIGILVVAGGLTMHQIIKGIVKYAIVKPIHGTVMLPIRIIRYTIGYIINVKMRKEIKAIKKIGDKIRLLEDMKNPIILANPKVLKYSLLREHKINKAHIKNTKNKKSNIDKVIK